MEERVINTGLKGVAAETIMGSALTRLAGTKSYHDTWFCKIRQVGGEVALLIDRTACYRRYGRFIENRLALMNDDEIKLWIAKLIKKTVKLELAFKADETGWKRSNSRKLLFLSNDGNNPPTVSDAYFVYDTLKGRKIEKWPYEWFSTVAAENVKCEQG